VSIVEQLIISTTSASWKWEQN